MRSSNSRRRRETDVFANRRLPVAQHGIIQRRYKPLTQYQDYRNWHPLFDLRPPMQMSRPISTYRTVTRPALPSQNRILRRQFLVKQPIWSLTDTTRQFVNPQKTLTCVRRHMRREVLHALGRTRGSGGAKSDNWTTRSNVRC